MGLGARAGLRTGREGLRIREGTEAWFSWWQGIRSGGKDNLRMGLKDQGLRGYV